MSDRIDLYQTVTDTIIRAIEAGAGAWEMPWHRQAGLPVNATTGKHYRGINVLNLWLTGEEEGYASNRWATFQQWRELGTPVKKGEKAALVVFWKIRDVETDADTAEAGEEETTRRTMFARHYCVFNAEQVEGYTHPAEGLSEAERHEAAERFAVRTGADIRHAGGRAFYSPTGDYIQLPPYAAFKTAAGYYSTLMHELTHFSGAESRLNRKLTGRFGDEAYAAEELIAELGAAFLCAQLGIASEPREDHAAYLANWLKVLKNDKRAIFTAASHAQKAADFLLQLGA